MRAHALAWTVRGPWNGKLYAFEVMKWKAERAKERFRRMGIPTVIGQEPCEGLYEELTSDQ